MDSFICVCVRPCETKYSYIQTCYYAHCVPFLSLPLLTSSLFSSPHPSSVSIHTFSCLIEVRPHTPAICGCALEVVFAQIKVCNEWALAPSAPLCQAWQWELWQDDTSLKELHPRSMCSVYFLRFIVIAKVGVWFGVGHEVHIKVFWPLSWVWSKCVISSFKEQLEEHQTNDMVFNLSHRGRKQKRRGTSWRPSNSIPQRETATCIMVSIDLFCYYSCKYANI